MGGADVLLVGHAASEQRTAAMESGRTRRGPCADERDARAGSSVIRWLLLRGTAKDDLAIGAPSKSIGAFELKVRAARPFLGSCPPPRSRVTPSRRSGPVEAREQPQGRDRLARPLSHDRYRAHLQGHALDRRSEGGRAFAGFYEESDRPNRALTLNTNGIVLEALLYVRVGVPLAEWARRGP